MRLAALISFALGMAALCGHPTAQGDIKGTTIGIVRFGLSYEGEAVYIRNPNLTIEQGTPTIRVPLAETVRTELAFVNGYDSDILLKVAPEEEVLLPVSDVRYSFDTPSPARYTKTRSAGSSPFVHHRTYESLKGVRGDRPPHGTNLFACCCMTKTLIWERALLDDVHASGSFTALTNAQFKLPITVNYVVLGSTNVYETETELRIIAEKGQPTSACTEPSQKLGSVMRDVILPRHAAGLATMTTRDPCRWARVRRDAPHLPSGAHGIRSVCLATAQQDRGVNATGRLHSGEH